MRRLFALFALFALPAMAQFQAPKPCLMNGTGCGGSGSGTVTSVGNGTISGLFTASWATATTTPALSLDMAPVPSNYFLAGPEIPFSLAAAPTFRALVSADLGAGTLSPNFLQVLVGDGTAAAPSIAFANDPNTGFKSIFSSDYLGLVAGGVERITFGGTGIHFQNVGEVRWSRSSTAVDVADFGFARSSAGLGKVTSGGNNLGSLQAGNLTATALTTPAITSPLTVNGTPGSTTYGYKAVAFLNDGSHTVASPEVTVATGPATLDGTDNITVAWPAVANQAYSELYRTTPLPIVKVYSGVAPSYIDIGTDLGAATPATTNTTGIVTASRVLVGDGTALSPSVELANYPGFGLYYHAGAGQLIATHGSVPVAGFHSTNGLNISQHLPLTWSAFGGAASLYLTHRAAATLQLGAADSATPVAQVLTAQGARDGIDTDTAGPAFTFRTPLGTGTGAASEFVVETPSVGATGTTLQTPAKRLGIKQGHFNISGLASYASNAAALVGGLVAGDIYTVTSSDPLTLAIVY